MRDDIFPSVAPLQPYSLNQIYLTGAIGDVFQIGVTTA
jgi:hypothetical protein